MSNKEVVTMKEIAVLLAALVLVVLSVRARLRQSGPSPHTRLFETLWRAIPADGDDHTSRLSFIKSPLQGGKKEFFG
jgi:hypothetical protein